MSSVTPETHSPLIAFDTREVKKELRLTQPFDDKNNALQQRAQASIEQLLGIEPHDVKEKNNSIAAVESIGIELQKMAAKRSNMLKQSIHVLSKTGDDGGPVATSLIDLRTTVEALDPNNIDLSKNWFRRLISSLHFIGTPIEEYFSRYQ
jgi:hypothetical protein